MGDLIKKSYDLYMDILNDDISLDDAKSQINNITYALEEDYLGQVFRTKKNLYRCKLLIYVKYNESLFYELDGMYIPSKLRQLSNWFRPIDASDSVYFEYYFELEDFKKIYNNREVEEELLLKEYNQYAGKLSMIDKDLYSDEYMEILRFGSIVESYLY